MRIYMWKQMSLVFLSVSQWVRSSDHAAGWGLRGWGWRGWLRGQKDICRWVSECKRVFTCLFMCRKTLGMKLYGCFTETIWLFMCTKSLGMKVYGCFYREDLTVHVLWVSRHETVWLFLPRRYCLFMFTKSLGMKVYGCFNRNDLIVHVYEISRREIEWLVSTRRYCLFVCVTSLGKKIVWLVLFQCTISSICCVVCCEYTNKTGGTKSLT